MSEEKEICEGCEKEYPIDTMRMENDGLWLCTCCFNELLKEAENEQDS